MNCFSISFQFFWMYTQDAIVGICTFFSYIQVIYILNHLNSTNEALLATTQSISSSICPTSRESCLYFLPSFTHFTFPSTHSILASAFLILHQLISCQSHWQFPASFTVVSCCLNSIQHCRSILPSGNTYIPLNSIFPYIIYFLDYLSGCPKINPLPRLQLLVILGYFEYIALFLSK